MVLEMQIPSPGESISEVEIAEWLVADGEYVEKDQIIAEIDSDKATLELPAEQSGVITLKADEGDVVQVGQVVCHIDTSAKGSPKETIASKPVEIAEDKKELSQPVVDTKSDVLSPAARKIAEEKNIDINQITGTEKLVELQNRMYYLANLPWVTLIIQIGQNLEISYRCLEERLLKD